METYTQANVFMGGMRERHTRFSLERAEPAILEEVFAYALRDKFRLTMAYTKSSAFTVARLSAGCQRQCRII